MSTETVLLFDTFVGTFGAGMGSAIGYALGGGSGAIQGGLYGINAVLIFAQNSLFLSKREKEINSIVMYAFQAILLASQYYQLSSGDLPGRCKSTPESLGCSMEKIVQITFKVFSGVTAICATYWSLAQYYRREQRLKTWIIGKNEVQLVRKGPKLECKIIDLPTKEVVKRTSIVNNMFTAKKIGEELKQFQVILRDFHNPTFTKPLHTWRFSGGEKEVHLLRDQFGLVFQVYDTYTKKTQQGLAFCRKMKRNPDASQETQTCMDHLARLSDEKLRKVCQEVKVHEIKKLKQRKITRLPDIGVYHGTISPFFITFEPLSTESHIDRRILLSHNYWGVTLIRYKGALENHAMIVIEGMKDGKYFMDLTDFTGGRVRYEPIYQGKWDDDKEFKFTPEKLKWEGRTSVKKRYRKQVERMIIDIKQEMEKKKKTKAISPYLTCRDPFTTFVKTGLFILCSKKTCIIWAKKKLMLAGIYLKSEKDNWISITMRHTYLPEEFEKDPYPEWRCLKRLGITLFSENPKQI